MLPPGDCVDGSVLIGSALDVLPPPRIDDVAEFVGLPLNGGEFDLLLLIDE